MGEDLNRKRPPHPGFMACFMTLLAVILAQSADCGLNKPAGTELEELLRAISERAEQARTMRMEFTQEKHLSLLDKSIVVRGRVVVDKDRGYFAWHVHEPVRYSVIIKGRSVWQWDEHSDKVQKVPVSKLPSLDVVLTQMRLLFVGDLAQAGQHYDAELLKGGPPPMIQFTPRDGTSGMVGLKRFVVTVKDGTFDLASIRIEDINGDSTVIEFDKIERNPEFNDEEFSLKNLSRTNKF